MDTQRVFALVNVDLVLQSLKAEQIRPGEWLNVIGYITAIYPLPNRGGPGHQVINVHVQALIVWPAGPLDLARYEKSVKALGEGGGSAALARSTTPSDTISQS